MVNHSLWAQNPGQGRHRDAEEEMERASGP